MINNLVIDIRAVPLDILAVDSACFGVDLVLVFSSVSTQHIANKQCRVPIRGYATLRACAHGCGQRLDWGECNFYVEIAAECIHFEGDALGMGVVDI